MEPKENKALLKPKKTKAKKNTELDAEQLKDPDKEIIVTIFDSAAKRHGSKGNQFVPDDIEERVLTGKYSKEEREAEKERKQVEKVFEQMRQRKAAK